MSRITGSRAAGSCAKRSRKIVHVFTLERSCHHANHRIDGDDARRLQRESAEKCDGAAPRMSDEEAHRFRERYRDGLEIRDAAFERHRSRHVRALAVSALVVREDAMRCREPFAELRPETARTRDP